MDHFPAVANAIKSFSEKFNRFYVTGGVVRDFYLNKYHDFCFLANHDIDIISEMNLDEVKLILPKAFYTNQDKLTLSFFHKGLLFDIVSSGNLPIEEELKRRDITINSLAWYCENGKFDLETPCDPSGGLPDLRYRVLRCIRTQNFRDDPVRLLRIFRFQSLYGFEIEDSTLQGVEETAVLIETVAKERIIKEFRKMLEGSHLVKALRTLKRTALFGHLFKDLEPSFDFMHQDSHHYAESVFEHTLRVVENCENNESARFAALFHDTGKMAVFEVHRKLGQAIGRIHYLQHEKKSCVLLSDFAEKYCFPEKVKKEALQMVKYHMLPLDSLKSLKKAAVEFRSVEAFDRFIRLVIADKKACNPDFEQSQTGNLFINNAEKVRNMYPLIKQNHELFSGEFLISVGFLPCPAFGLMIDYLKKKAFQKDFVVDETMAVHFLEKAFYYRGKYSELYYKKHFFHRKVEYYTQGKIIGLLEGDTEMKIPTELFELQYVKEENLTACLTTESVAGGTAVKSYIFYSS